jgi:sugar O-acyltransferase (sialic acid O-acetyltransferase NeuD family)
MGKVIIFGNGQGASVNYMDLKRDTQDEITAFTVDRKYIQTNTLFGLPVVAFEDVESIYPPGEYKMSIFVSYRRLNRVRAEKYDQAKNKGYELINCIAPNARTYSDLIIGDNCFIGDYAFIGPFTTIGTDVVVGPGALIGHNCVIKDHCFIGPHAAILGFTTIEPYCLIGANSTIRDGGIVISRECIIAAGTVINQNTRERSVYTGNPGRRAQRGSEGLSTWLTFGMK